MQTLIRLNLVILLSLVTLAVLGFVALAGVGYGKTYATVRFLEHTTCATMLQDLKSQDPAKAKVYGEAFQAAAHSSMEYVDEDLYTSRLSFAKLLRGCFAQPEHTLYQILVANTSTGIAAQVTDLYNTLAGELESSTPMAPELYVTPAGTSPTTVEVSTTSPDTQH